MTTTREVPPRAVDSRGVTVHRILRCALLAALVLAAPAQAGKVTIGSDLTGQVNETQSHPRDWAAWGNEPSGSAIVAPVQGEVAIAQFKGTVLKPDNDAAYNGQYPSFAFRVVVLRPQSDGTKKLMVATQPLPFPFGGDDQRVTTFDLQQYPAKICVVPGDIVALDTNGGFGHHSGGGAFPDDFFAEGYPVRMFSDSPLSYGLFKQAPADDGTFQVGTSVRSTNVAGQELLMRATIGTAADARWWCRTKQEQAANLPAPGATPTPAPEAGATMVAPPRPLRIKHKKITVTVRCPGPSTCRGTVELRHGGKGFGRARFALAGGTTGPVAVKLTRAARRHLRTDHGSVPFKAVVATPAGRTAQHFTVKKA
ncbi:MAG: hypothetical protein QOI80_1589 [Solirubrobacteraceae bacterium]|nr:hypothetical protein [Solirubrobacteraceae bacterium]